MSTDTKVIVIGDGGVGKTTFVRRHGVEERKYLPTLGVETTVVACVTNAGPLAFSLWDTAGGGRWGPRDGFYRGAHAVILMFDVQSRATIRNVESWHRDVQRVCGKKVPVLLLGNKVDRPRKVKAGHVASLLLRLMLSELVDRCRVATLCTVWALCRQPEGRALCFGNRDVKLVIAKLVWGWRWLGCWLPARDRVRFVALSAKSNLRLEQPLLLLARKLLGRSDVLFVQPPVVHGAVEATVDADAVRQFEAEVDGLVDTMVLTDDF
jgi:small GTP-binding protein